MDDTFQITIPQALEGISARLGTVTLCAAFSAPILSFDENDRALRGGGLSLGWAWRSRTVREEQSPALGCGYVTIDHFALDDLAFVREVFVPEGGTRLAIRGILKNRSKQGVRLGDWAVLDVGAGDLRLGKCPVDKWKLYCHGRHKNDHPVAVTLGHIDGNALLAAGIPQSPEGDMPLTYPSDPLAVLQGGEPPSTLLLGFVSELEHLATINVTIGPERTNLESLRAICEFDGCLVPAGMERQTSWLLLDADNDHHRSIRNYAETVAVLHNVPAPDSAQTKAVPSVYCTWSFYGWDLTPQDMDDELDWFEAQRWPIDVFQVDESWEAYFGDWQARPEWGGASMEGYARRIRDLGYTAGIWTCPYLADVSSQLAMEHPEWMLKKTDGEFVTFPMNYHDNYVLDPTHPEAQGWLAELYRRLTQEWGYTYHKFDFTRAVALAKDVAFHDPTVTRAQAYRRGFEVIRQAVGEQSYMLICGGLYLPGIGLADGQRAGSDVKSKWTGPRADLTIEQNLLRTWMNRLWHQDPDSCVIRRRADKRGRDELELTLGLFTDEEARTIIVNQYLGGGLICFSERMSELDTDRAALYACCIPSLGTASIPVDLFADQPAAPSGGRIPALHVTPVQPRAEGLSPWYTLAVINWADEAQNLALVLNESILLEGPDAEHPWFLCWEFFERRFMGRLAWGDALPSLTIPPHGTRVLRLAPWDGRMPTLLATDRHLSMGGVEIAKWSFDEGLIQARIESLPQYSERWHHDWWRHNWREPFDLWLACPAGNRPEGIRMIQQRVREGQDIVLRLYPKGGS